MESKLNWKEQKQLENTIDIVGLPNVDIKSAKECVIKIFTDALNVVVPDDYIENLSIRRIRVKDSALNNGKNIIRVKFSSFSIKKKVLIAKRSANKKLKTSLFSDADAKNIYINNSLTSYNQALFRAAKKLKKEKHFKYVWFNNSRLLLKKSVIST